MAEKKFLQSSWVCREFLSTVYQNQLLRHLQKVEHGIDSRHVFEGEVLVVEHHPLLTFLHRHVLNVGEKGYGDEHLAAVGQANQHLATMGSEVQVLDTYCYVFHFTHIFVLL